MNDTQMRYAIKMKTELDYEKGCQLMGLTPHPLNITFDIKGRTAGQQLRQNIRFNMDIIRNNFSQFMQRTPTHEVAHVLTTRKYPRASAHGREWQGVMWSVFGVEPSRCHNYDMENVPTRNTKTHLCDCACSEPHYVSTRLRNNMLKGKRYLCGKCRKPLTYVR